MTPAPHPSNTGDTQFTLHTRALPRTTTLDNSNAPLYYCQTEVRESHHLSRANPIGKKGQQMLETYTPASYIKFPLKDTWICAPISQKPARRDERARAPQTVGECQSLRRAPRTASGTCPSLHRTNTPRRLWLDMLAAAGTWLCC